MAKKIPNKKYNPVIKKKVRTDPSKIKPVGNPAWHIGKIDLSGPFGWKEIGKDIFLEKIYPKFKYFESMNWHEILNRNNHEVGVDRISKGARKRLEELRLDDIDYLVSLRFTGTQRVWGIRRSNIFQILWWDPFHKVYPTNKKHT